MMKLHTILFSLLSLSVVIPGLQAVEGQPSLRDFLCMRCHTIKDRKVRQQCHYTNVLMLKMLKAGHVTAGEAVAGGAVLGYSVSGVLHALFYGNPKASFFPVVALLGFFDHGVREAPGMAFTSTAFTALTTLCGAYIAKRVLYDGQKEVVALRKKQKAYHEACLANADCVHPEQDGLNDSLQELEDTFRSDVSEERMQEYVKLIAGDPRWETEFVQYCDSSFDSIFYNRIRLCRSGR